MKSALIQVGNRTELFDQYSHDIIASNLISVISKERNSLSFLIEHFPQSALTLVEAILKSTGRLVVTGHGKSGLIARKLASTFSSMGTPALFLHPTDALHGDLGMVQRNDFVLILSKSASGSELEQILPLLHAQGNSTGLISCSPGVLQNLVDVSVQLPFEEEACPLNLAPTSSSTIMLAFGDALAVVISRMIGFGKIDFAKYHPGGTLGKNLLFTVQHFMNTDNQLPLLNLDTPFNELLALISEKKLGVGIVIGQHNQLHGIITDGDLRRACNKGPKVFQTKAFDIMTINPKTVQPEHPAYRALEIMEDFNITTLIVTINKTVVGLVHIHDLIKAGIHR